MANRTKDLTTTAKVKTLLGITSATNDALIDQLVMWATDFIEGYTNRTFKEATYSNEIYDGGEPNQSGGFRNKLMLKNFPVSAVSVVEYMSGSYSAPTWNTLSADYWVLYGDEGYIQSLAGNFARGFKNYRTSYTAGYKIDFTNELTSTHTLPFDITMLATQLVAKIYDKRFSEGKSNETVEGQAISWRSELAPEQKSVLDSYTKNLL